MGREKRLSVREHLTRISFSSETIKEPWRCTKSADAVFDTRVFKCLATQRKVANTLTNGTQTQEDILNSRPIVPKLHCSKRRGGTAISVLPHRDYIAVRHMFTQNVSTRPYVSEGCLENAEDGTGPSVTHSPSAAILTRTCFVQNEGARDST